MSRCYPFPPPGFVPNQVRDESLIEPINKGTKKETKRDRKHNKDKKRKERDHEAGRSREHSHHKRQRRDGNADASKKVDDDNELEFLEKSCLTMELDHQASSQTSSENEGPNRIQSQSLNGRHNDSGEFVCLLVVGSVLLHVLATMMTLFLHIVAMGFEETSIRVLLHGKGQVMTNKDQKQSSSREKLDSSHLVDSKKEETKRQFSMQLGKEKGASSHQDSIGPSKLCSKCPPSTATRFSKLIENWAPDRFDETKLTYSEDQDWWLLMKVGAKRHHQVSGQTRSKGSSSMVWPTAQFLPEAELLALPFTVPF
ncbi:hypothetical protein HA466_0016860 [Hirschfeldia incana]|nr:hypothetical protein HA466_0016860 [Hirschfeldia incana]